MKPFTKIASILFGIGALVHLYRLFSQFPIVIGNYEAPVAASVVIFIFAMALCAGLWRESTK